MNKVVLTGRLTKDPELKKTNSGISYCFFTIAVNRSYVNRQGNREADFINCVAWRVQAENLARYMRKGSLIGVDGEVRTRSYQDQDNKMVYITEILANAIEFLESKYQRYAFKREIINGKIQDSTKYLLPNGIYSSKNYGNFEVLGLSERKCGNIKLYKIIKCY